MKTLDKLSVRTSDYVAAINVSDKLLASLVSCSQGVAYSGREQPLICRSVNKVTHLEESAFDKVVTPYSPNLNLGELIRIADHGAMVLVTCVPNDGYLCGVESYLERKGVFETWCFRTGKEDYLDLLFKVRKYD